MPIKVKMIGEPFGRLTVLARAPSRGKASNLRGYWLCQCSCGKQVEISTGALRSMNQQSCGCLKKERCIERSTKHGQAAVRTRAYNAWKGMRKRCLNPNERVFKYYGGRGITIAPEWCFFEQFYRDMGDPPAKMSLDRKDTNGNYCKDNCRWATVQQQVENRRVAYNVKLSADVARAVYIAHKNGKVQDDLAKQYGVCQSAISAIMRGRIWTKATADLRASP